MWVSERETIKTTERQKDNACVYCEKKTYNHMRLQWGVYLCETHVSQVSTNSKSEIHILRKQSQSIAAS